MYIVVQSPEHLAQVKAERKAFLANRRKARKAEQKKTEKLQDKFFQKEYTWMNRRRERAREYNCTEIEDIYPSVVYFRDKGICGICKKYIMLDHFSVDHKIPMSKGGQHTYKNVQAAHLKCNNLKQDLLPEEYEVKYDY